MQNFSGLEYIKIMAANAYGLDKKVWSERISWFDTNIENMLQGSLDLKEAKEPALLVKAILAYQDAINQVPTGYIGSLDATASGIQLIAVLTGCIKSATTCNLVNTGKRMNAYKVVADIAGEDEEVMKKPIMTTFYGSQKQPESVFGKGTQRLTNFYDTLYKEMPGCMEYLGFVSSIWNPEAEYYTWTLPDGHTAHVAVTAMVDKKVEVAELNKSTFTFRTEEVQAQEKGRSLQANIIQSFDAYVVRQMIIRCKKLGFDILTIHDCFWASPNNMNRLRQAYREIMSDIARNNYLQDVLRQITKDTSLKLIKENADELADLILESEYALS